jgi:hypothetical protein
MCSRPSLALTVRKQGLGAKPVHSFPPGTRLENVADQLAAISIVRREASSLEKRDSQLELAQLWVGVL